MLASTGNMTVTPYTLGARWKPSDHPELVARLAEAISFYAFRPLSPSDTKSESVGWCSFDAPFAEVESWDLERLEAEGCYKLGVRIDKYSYPPKLLEEQLHKVIRLYNPNHTSSTPLSLYLRPDLSRWKEEARTELRVKKLVLPKTSHVNVVFDPYHGRLWVGTVSSSVLNHVTDLLRRTLDYGVKYEDGAPVHVDEPSNPATRLSIGFEDPDLPSMINRALREMAPREVEDIDVDFHLRWLIFILGNTYHQKEGVRASFRFPSDDEESLRLVNYRDLFPWLLRNWTLTDLSPEKSGVMMGDKHTLRVFGSPQNPSEHRVTVDQKMGEDGFRLIRSLLEGEAAHTSASGTLVAVGGVSDGFLTDFVLKEDIPVPVSVDVPSGPVRTRLHMLDGVNDLFYLVVARTIAEYLLLCHRVLSGNPSEPLVESLYNEESLARTDILSPHLIEVLEKDNLPADRVESYIPLVFPPSAYFE